MKKHEVSIIFSTYNQVQWLEKVFWGFEQQSFQDFEIIVADDGSTEDTATLISSYQRKSNLTIRHVWQEDHGFQKTKILNKAIAAAKTDYLIFTDGDCIPRKDFISQHLKYRKQNCFLSGGYFKLPMNISKLISYDHIQNQKCFELEWLKKNGLSSSLKNFKLLPPSSLLPTILNKFTTTTPSWNGHNASTWKKHALEINGFDERMQYGGEDREFGERLMNLGIKPIQIRYFAICLHLDHSRGYIDQKSLELNSKIRQETKINKTVKTSFGIKE